MRNKFVPFTIGILSGSLLLLFLMSSALLWLPSWLVVQNNSHQADLAIVLGGGGGSRLRQSLKLYEKKLIPNLLLISHKDRSWKHITTILCPDCDLQDKKVTLKDGSLSTFTDAQIALEYCQVANLKKVLVITDPYHTRRTALIFNYYFKKSGIKVTVLSSGDYRDLTPPQIKWWTDEKSRETIWLEFGKCLHVLAKIYLFRGND